MLFIIGLLLGAVVVVFILQNFIPVTVTFLAWQLDGNLAVILIVAVLLGMIISWLLSLPELLKAGHFRKRAERLEEDLNAHKQKLSETEGKLAQAEAPVVIEKTVIVDSTNDTHAV